MLFETEHHHPVDLDVTDIEENFPQSTMSCRIREYRKQLTGIYFSYDDVLALECQAYAKEESLEKRISAIRCHLQNIDEQRESAPPAVYSANPLATSNTLDGFNEHLTPKKLKSCIKSSTTAMGLMAVRAQPVRFMNIPFIVVPFPRAGLYLRPLVKWKP